VNSAGGRRTTFCTHGSANQPAPRRASVVHSSKAQQWLSWNTSSRTVMMTSSIEMGLRYAQKAYDLNARLRPMSGLGFSVRGSAFHILQPRLFTRMTCEKSFGGGLHLFIRPRHSRRPEFWLRPRAKARSSRFSRLIPSALPVPWPCPARLF
jgi:hypothetical protein